MSGRNTKGVGVGKKKPQTNRKQDGQTSAEKRVVILERENMMLRKNLNMEEIKKEFQKAIHTSDMDMLFYETLHDLECRVRQYESKTDEDASGNFTELKQDLENGRRKIKSLEKDLLDKTTLINEKDKRQQEIEAQKDNVGHSSDSTVKLKELQSKCDMLEYELQTEKSRKQIDMLNTENTELKAKMDQQEKDLSTLRKELRRKEDALQELKEKVSSVRKDSGTEASVKHANEISSLKGELTEAKSKHNETSKTLSQIEVQIKQMEEEHKKRINVKDGLSNVVGANNLNDNPNIPDLSDENRPTKLSEKFSELYDSEWVDAYEEAEEDIHTEEKSIAFLYKSLEDIFDFCKHKSQEHANSIKSCVLTVPNSANGRPNAAKIGVTSLRLLKELRRSFAPYLIDSVFQQFISTKKTELSGKKNTEKFLRRCVEICWLMNSQDPPVILDTSKVKGKDFDGDRFRTYTKSGKIVDYVVWPPMLLHEGGPLLCKGVAQGK